MTSTVAGLVLAHLLSQAPTPVVPGYTEPPQHRVTLGASRVSQMGVFRDLADGPLVEVAYGFLPRGRFAQVELGGGLRAGGRREGVTVPGEVFVRARLEGRIGDSVWRPAVGPELGVTGLGADSPRPDGLPDDLDRAFAARRSPLYLSVDLAPLRFTWRDFTLSAMEVSFGAPLFPTGTSLRTELSFVSLGWTP